jgi:hypothetical protein
MENISYFGEKIDPSNPFIILNDLFIELKKSLNKDDLREFQNFGQAFRFNNKKLSDIITVNSKEEIKEIILAFIDYILKQTSESTTISPEGKKLIINKMKKLRDEIDPPNNTLYIISAIVLLLVLLLAFLFFKKK